MKCKGRGLTSTGGGCCGKGLKRVGAGRRKKRGVGKTLAAIGRVGGLAASELEKLGAYYPSLRKKTKRAWRGKGKSKKGVGSWMQTIGKYGRQGANDASAIGTVYKDRRRAWKKTLGGARRRRKIRAVRGPLSLKRANIAHEPTTNI